MGQGSFGAVLIASRFGKQEANMTYEFAGTLYPNCRAMLDAMAFDWMTAGGNNNPEDMDWLVNAGLTAKEASDECIDGWKLDEPLNGEGESDMEKHGYDRDDLIAAFERFLATRPDWTLEALFAYEGEDGKVHPRYDSRRAAAVQDIAEHIEGKILEDLDPHFLAEAVMAKAEEMGRIDGNEVSGEIHSRYTKNGNPIAF